MGGKPAVDTPGIGSTGCLYRARKALQVISGKAGEAENAHGPVAGQQPFAAYFSETPLRTATDGFHLPESVLDEDKIQGEIGIELVFCADMGNAMGIAKYFYGRLGTGQGERPLGDR